MNQALRYSDIVKAGLILPKKTKYTKRHIKDALLNSLFKPINGRTLTQDEARFVVKCSAAYHDTTWGKL
jgi:hypothetical protein